MIRYRVRKAIELRDSVTGAPVVSGAVRIFTSGALKRLDKGDGLIVLIDDGKGEGIPEEIKISGNSYLEERCMVETYSKSSAQVCTTWLLPAPGYAVPAGVAAIKGKAAAGAQIELANPKDRESLKLAEDYAPGSETIKLYHERGIDPMGKWYRAVSGDDIETIFIGSVVERTSDYTEYMAGEYAGSTALKSSGTAFYPMLRTRADDKGEYLAAAAFVTAADTELLLTFSPSVFESADGKRTLPGAEITDPESNTGNGKGGKSSKSGRNGRKAGNDPREAGPEDGKTVTIHVSPGERLRIDEKES